MLFFAIPRFPAFRLVELAAVARAYARRPRPLPIGSPGDRRLLRSLAQRIGSPGDRKLLRSLAQRGTTRRKLSYRQSTTRFYIKLRVDCSITYIDCYNKISETISTISLLARTPVHKTFTTGSLRASLITLQDSNYSVP